MSYEFRDFVDDMEKVLKTVQKPKAVFSVMFPNTTDFTKDDIENSTYQYVDDDEIYFKMPSEFPPYVQFAIYKEIILNKKDKPPKKRKNTPW